MIINCEKCGSKFNLDENLLNKNGSRVRCSVCKNVFVAMPPEPEEESLDSSPEETVDLDSAPAFEEKADYTMGDDRAEENFDKGFDDTLNEDIREDVIKEEEAVKAEKKEPEVATQKIKRKSSLLPRLILIIIIVVFILILGAVYVYFFAPDLLPAKLSGRQPPDQEDLADSGNKRLEFEGIDYDTISTDNIGKLFIIKGKVINNYPDSRSHILLKGTIEDEKGNPIDRKLAYAGNIFTEHELKNITIKEIEKRLNNKSGKKNSNIDVAPQGSVPFMIIFYNLPDSISEYVVETISSSPGQ